MMMSQEIGKNVTFYSPFTDACYFIYMGVMVSIIQI